MERPPLTSLQRRVLGQIARFIRQKGYAPSYREIARACHFKSLRSVAQCLDVLEREGHLSRVRGVSRSMQVTG